MGGTSVGARTRLLVLQSTPFCNIDCTYCYLPHRSSRKALPLDRAAQLFPRLLRLPTIRGHVSVVWHAGEPMARPIGYYEGLLGIVREATPPGLAVTQAFQTNGTLITPAWCRFIRANGIGMGVSLDGPQAIHDANRRRRDGSGTFEATMRGIRLLQAEGIPFHVITVLTAASLRAPDAMFDFFLDSGIRQVCFNIEEQEGTHTHTSLAGRPDAVALYRAFLRRFAERDLAAGWPIGVREVDAAFAAVRAAGVHAFASDEAVPFEIISVDTEGNLSTFSPELLSQTHPRYGGFAFGNLLDDDFEVIAGRVLSSPLARDIAAGIERCRRECTYFALCGGGTPSNKIFENGTADSTETLYCRVHRATIDFALELLEAIPEPSGAFQTT